MAILTVVLGVVFVLLLLSLLATTIMELIAAFFGLRGRNLRKALENILVGDKADGQADRSLFEAFRGNPLFKQLSVRYGQRSTNPPSYVSPESFRTILFDIILGEKGLEDELQKKIDALDNADLRRVLNQLLREADGKVDVFKGKVEGWYNSVMDRAAGWYKRNCQKILIYIGLFIAVAINADTLALYERLESDPETLNTIVAAAEKVAASDSVDDLVKTDLEFEQAVAQLESIKSQVDNLKSPLGLGWKNVDLQTATAYDWLTKVLGWIVTALAISLGAPFWFDMLRKIVNIRSSGSKPA